MTRSFLTTRNAGSLHRESILVRRKIHYQLNSSTTQQMNQNYLEDSPTRTAPGTGTTVLEKNLCEIYSMNLLFVRFLS